MVLGSQSVVSKEKPGFQVCVSSRPLQGRTEVAKGQGSTFYSVGPRAGPVAELMLEPRPSVLRVQC